MADEQQDQTDQRDADQPDQHDDTHATTDTDDLGDKGRQAIQREREARKAAEKARADLEKRVKAFEDAQKTEAQRQQDALEAAEQRANTFEQRYRGVVTRSAVAEEATKAGAISTNAVYALIRDDITFSDDGEPTNVTKLIAKARDDEPQLFRASGGSGDGGKGNGTTTKQSLNDLIRAGLQPG